MILGSGAPAPPAPSPTSGHSKVDLEQIISSVAHGIWTAATSSAWSELVTALFVLIIGVQVVHAVAYPTWIRDPIRRFSRQDKAELLRRAGGRCEHHSRIVGRCNATGDLEADHVIPWSRSGPTIVGNGQALCRRHNRDKRATIPFSWQLRAIEKRRSAYYPVGVPGQVVRRRPR